MRKEESQEEKKESFQERKEERREQLIERTEEVKKQFQEKRGSYSFKRIMKAAFNLSADQASYEEIDERIESGVELRGTNLCILILAIFIASVGLNMNSTAVIIGAMLISPLMGAIMGVGFGIAIYDTDLLKRSFTILIFEVIVALLTSTVYFMLSPITTPSSELLARTSPTAWDVIIAVCGGLAGMIGTTRKEKSNIIPGVAIATALMPPLCTAGFGLASHNLRYFAGAMYLFCINGIFIAITTMLITVFLGIPVKKVANAKRRRNILKRIVIVSVVAIVPSVFLAADIVHDSVIQNNVDRFVNQEFQFDNTQVVKYELDKEKKQLEVAVIGATIDEDVITALENSMTEYHIDSFTLQVQQTLVKNGITQEELETYVKNETSKYEAGKYDTVLQSDYEDLQSQLLAAKTELANYQNENAVSAAVIKEVKTLYPEVLDVWAGYIMNESSRQAVVILQVRQEYDSDTIKTLTDFLCTRLQAEEIQIYQNLAEE